LNHSHSFGQDRKRPGEIRAIIVIGVTAAMMAAGAVHAGRAFRDQLGNHPGAVAIKTIITRDQ